MSIDGKTSLKGIVLAISIAMLLGVPVSIFHSTTTEGSTSTGKPLDLSSIYWPMIGKDPYHTSSGDPGARGLMDPVVSWSGNTTSLAAVGGDMTSNLVFDGVTSIEVFGIVESNNTHVRVREGDSGIIMWEMDVRRIEGRATNRLRTSPSLSDIDSDGKLEVIIYIRDVNQFQLGVFEPVITKNSTGYHYSATNYFDERVWLSILVPSVPDPYSSPILHDMSGDGVEDILVGSGSNLAAFFGNNGTAMWFLPIGQIGETLSTPAIYTGTLNRIVINSLSTSRQNLRTTLVSFDGTHLMNTSVALGRTVPYQYTGRITTPVIGDISGDGGSEIMVSYPSRFGEGRIVVYSNQLSELATISNIQGLLESTPSIADADGDGDMEIFFHSRYYTTTSWINMSCYDIVPQGPDLTVSLRWWRDGSNVGTSPLYTSPLLCDLDDDNAPDAVFFANDWVHAVSFAGSSLWTIPITTPQFGYQGLIGDLGRDDFTDIFFDGILISQKVVDLTVKDPPGSNIYVDSEPVDGKIVNLLCIVENLGTSSATEVTVMFEATPPGGERTLIGYSIIDELTTTAEASVEWTPAGVGNHMIDVTVDPNSTIIETDESNNIGSTQFSVRTAIPDLIVHDVKFIRGDGLIIEGVDSDKSLVEMDTSTVQVQVGNIGEGPSFVGLVDIFINGSSPGSQAEEVPIPSVRPGEIALVNISWTPDELEGAQSAIYNVTAEIDTDTQGMQELDKFNNKGYNISRVKSVLPIGGFEISGRVYNSQAQGEQDARVTASNERSQYSLEDDTNFQGDYSIYFPLTDYLDGDVISLYGKKTTSWAQNSTRIYSEDGEGTVNLWLTDVPTLSLDLIPDGQLDNEVLPRSQYNFRFWAENTGNIPGEFTLERTLSGNTSLTTNDILISPSSFSLGAGERKEIQIRFTVPASEEPGKVAIVDLLGTINGNGSDTSSLSYRFTVGSSGIIYYEFESEKNVTLNANKDNSASFRIYLLNKGNIDVEYNMTTSGSLQDLAVIQRGGGTLEPSDSTQVEILVTLNGTVDRLIGSIDLRTSGAPSRVSWDIRIDMKYPNLVADDLIRVTDENVELGDRITLLGTVTNDGDVEVEDVSCSFYEDDTLIGSTVLSFLDAGEEATLPGVDWEPSGIGEREITFRIDPDGLLTEEDEDDNEAGRTFSFFPDISISSVELEPPLVQKGQQVRAKVTVKNMGNAKIDRGFTLTVKNGGSLGEKLAEKDFDEDIPTGGINTLEVEIDIIAPEEPGKTNLWFGVTLLVAQERNKDNNDASKELEIEEPVKIGTDYTIPIIIAVAIVIIAVGASLYIWKFGLPISPPPGEQEAPSGEDQGPSVEQGPVVSGMDLIPREEEEPILEMHLEPSSEFEAPMEEVVEEEVIVAEVIEVIEDDDGPDIPVPPEPFAPESMMEEDDEGLIPEV